MVKKKSINIKANLVKVASATTSKIISPKSVKRRRRRNTKVPFATKVSKELAPLVAGGTMTMEPRLAKLYSYDKVIELDSSVLGWFYKYLDPAGSVETMRAIGDFNAIPDDMLEYCVTAEARVIDNLTVPGAVESSVPLDGTIWSVVVISLSCFRTNFIAIANTLNEDLSQEVMNQVVEDLNNLVNPRDIIDTAEWIPVTGSDDEPTWFWRVFTYPPTYNFPEPIEGQNRMVEGYRYAHKGLTIETNAPVLVNQGLWAGAMYPLKPSITTQESLQSTNIPSWIDVRNVTLGQDWTLNITNMPQVIPNERPSDALPNSNHLSYRVPAGATGTFDMPIGVTIYNPFDDVWAGNDGTDINVVTYARNIGSVVLTSDRVGTTPITIPLAGFVLAHGVAKLWISNPNLAVLGGTSSTLAMPASTLEQVAANNPKMGQFTMQQSGGAYLVHSKALNPVFDLTQAANFGPIQFSNVGYDLTRNHNDGSGILDSFDSNFNTGCVVIKGISKANNLIVKTYFGWQGVTNTNTPIGQFGHAPPPKCAEVLMLADEIMSRSTGIFPATSNFLGSISRMASGLLSRLLSSQATQAMIGNLASSAVHAAGGWFEKV